MVSLFFSFWSPHQRQEIVRLMRMLPSAPCGAEPLAIYHICVFNFSWECSFCSQFSSSDSESTAAFWSVSDLPAPRAQAAPRRPRCRKPPSPRWSEGTTPGPGCGGPGGLGSENTQYLTKSARYIYIYIYIYIYDGLDVGFVDVGLLLHVPMFPLLPAFAFPFPSASRNGLYYFI